MYKPYHNKLRCIIESNIVTYGIKEAYDNRERCKEEAYPVVYVLRTEGTEIFHSTDETLNQHDSTVHASEYFPPKGKCRQL